MGSLRLRSPRCRAITRPLLENHRLIADAYTRLIASESESYLAFTRTLSEWRGTELAAGLDILADIFDDSLPLVL